MSDGDCLESTDSWNQFITYVQHSSCTAFTIFSTCTSTGQAFRFTQAGTMSTSYGGTNVGDDRQWIANDADTYPYIEGLGGSHLKFYTGNDIYFYDNAVEEFRFYDNSVDIKGDRAIYINAAETHIGHGAGDSITTGVGNTLVGHDAGNSITTGMYNAAIGSSLQACTGGDFNMAIGHNALHACTFGYDNVGIGIAACYLLTTGINNVSIGKAALRSITTVDGCVGIGHNAGYNNLAGNRLYINNSDSAYPLIYGEFDNDIVAFGDNSAAWNIKFVSSAMHMLETTTPTAIPNYGAIYTKNDNKLYFQDGAGVEHEVAFV